MATTRMRRYSLIRGRSTVAMVQLVVAPALLAARLPFWPMCKEVAQAEVVVDEAADVNEVAETVVGAVEVCPNSVAGVDASEDRFRSRLLGPDFKWRTLDLQHTQKFGRTNPVVHAWAVVACWLRAALTSKVQ